MSVTKLLLFVISLVGIMSCKNIGRNENQTAILNDQQYLNIALRTDTLNTPQRLTLMDSVLSGFTKTDTAENIYFNYFKGCDSYFKKQSDSAIFFYEKMNTPSKSNEWWLLKQYQELSILINQQGTVASDIVIEILGVIKQAEAFNSMFTYRLYDLLAKAYYNNHNIEKSKQYTELYYSHHPFRLHPVISQRYHDISFMLAQTEKDTIAMRRHLVSSRMLALKIKDSTALMRTYDYESQLFALRGQSREALEKSRIFFRYFSHHNILSTYWFNNLATSFNRNGQTDSAIYYYNKGIEWSGKFQPNISLFELYNGLKDAYWKKEDYKNAVVAYDSALQIYSRNTTKIQNEKIEAIHTQYQTEKKDRVIAALNTTNALNRKIIAQQKWIFISVSILILILGLYLYNYFKKGILKEKNEKLQIENKRLILEQKTSQMQLNPHFIYNAIANLQGLISSDDKVKANSYLVSFSKLIRNFLELNRNEYITLAEEIASLKNYIHLQQMRFEHKFDYSINTGNTDIQTTMIPPLLLQPFIENSIEHGFKNIEYNGWITIGFEVKDNLLHIRVADNGAGFQSSEERPVIPKKSLSKVIIQERLDVLFNQQERKAWFETGNGKDTTGWTTQIVIPLITA